MSCDCGINGDMIEFDGIDDFIEFDTAYTEYFQNDFSISFYFMLNNPTNPVDILTVQRTECKKDSSMTCKYVPVTNEILFEYSLTFGQSIRLIGELNPDRCWNHVTFTKNDNDYSLYLNGLKVDEASISTIIKIHPESVLKIANGPCLGITDERFRGYLDELRIHTTALDENQVFDLYDQVDALVSVDTTLYIGDGIQIESWPSCVQNINWFPATGVDDTSISEPFITPVTSETYTIEYDHGFCLAKDTILIVLVDPDDLECANLLLPNAFTPNGDGKNDLFGISNAFLIEEFISFEIFDRWGGLVFNAENKNQLWDGNIAGTSVNSGIMMYRVKYRCGGEEFIKIGSFSILR
jgi:gliding motility-associated-like protein